jgi:starvation-inducible DNA-binding protein
MTRPPSGGRVRSVIPPAMKINIGLNDEARLEVGQMLNLLLADETMLYATTRDYHWNVTGPEFLALHQQFETQYGQLADSIDAIAERARAIGIGARGSLIELAKRVRSSAAAGTGLGATQMISGLLALHEDLIMQLRTDSAACAVRFNDAGTADFLTGLMVGHEKTAWLLRSQLESADAETA